VQLYLYPLNASLILLSLYLKKRSHQSYQQTYRQLFSRLARHI